MAARRISGRYDPLRVKTVSIGGVSHRATRGGSRTLCGLVTTGREQLTLDKDATCLWCKMHMDERRKK
jgi:hypothetical protein